VTGAPTGYADVRGLRIAYHTWGDPKQPAVLCLHGFLDHGRSYEDVAAPLSADYFVVAPDFRGHGHSDWIGAGGYYHFPDYFTDTYAVVEHLGLERVSIIGHSMGGSITTGVAVLLGDRVDAVMLLEGMGPPTEDLSVAPKRLRRWAQSLRNVDCKGDVAARRARRRVMADIGAAAHRLTMTNPRLPRPRAERMATTFTEPVEGGVAWRYDPLHRTPSARPFGLEEVRHMWAAIEAPVLSLYGEHTPFSLLDIGERHQQLKSVRCAMVTAAGHNLHHDQPEVIAAAAQAWLTERGRAAPLTAGLVEVGVGLS